MGHDSNAICRFLAENPVKGLQHIRLHLPAASAARAQVLLIVAADPLLIGGVFLQLFIGLSFEDAKIHLSESGAHLTRLFRLFTEQDLQRFIRPFHATRIIGVPLPVYVICGRCFSPQCFFSCRAERPIQASAVEVLLICFRHSVAQKEDLFAQSLLSFRRIYKDLRNSANHADHFRAGSGEFLQVTAGQFSPPSVDRVDRHDPAGDVLTDDHCIAAEVLR